VVLLLLLVALLLYWPPVLLLDGPGLIIDIGQTQTVIIIVISPDGSSDRIVLLLVYSDGDWPIIDWLMTQLLIQYWYWYWPSYWRTKLLYYWWLLLVLYWLTVTQLMVLVLLLRPIIVGNWLLLVIIDPIDALMTVLLLVLLVMTGRTKTQWLVSWYLTFIDPIGELLIVVDYCYLLVNWTDGLLDIIDDIVYCYWLLVEPRQLLMTQADSDIDCCWCYWWYCIVWLLIDYWYYCMDIVVLLMNYYYWLLVTHCGLASYCVGVASPANDGPSPDGLDIIGQLLLILLLLLYYWKASWMTHWADIVIVYWIIIGSDDNPVDVMSQWANPVLILMIYCWTMTQWPNWTQY